MQTIELKPVMHGPKTKLQAMLAEAETEYNTYVSEQAKLSLAGEGDREFMSLMDSAARHEDRYWEKLFEQRRNKRGRFLTKPKQRMKYLRRTWDNQLIAVPAVAPKKVPSRQEQDALIFEQGADWLETHKWARGWSEMVTLPDGRTVQARCALGSVLAANHQWDDGGTPTHEGERRLNGALGRLGMCMDDVINYNDNNAKGPREVARYLRGLAYQIREFGS